MSQMCVAHEIFITAKHNDAVLKKSLYSKKVKIFVMQLNLMLETKKIYNIFSKLPMTPKSAFNIQKSQRPRYLRDLKKYL